MARVARVVVAALLAVSALGAPAGGRARVPSRRLGAVTIAPEGNLGRVDSRGDLAAVLQRSAGVVTLVDVGDPAHPAVAGAYDDDAQDSLDGDVAFSHDGDHLFYARQTEQFSKDGLLVLDVSDPANPALASYQPGGGALRVDSYYDGATEWVFLLDAVEGLVVYRFVPEAGVLVPVHVDPLPATKVGGPASGGLYVDESDPQLHLPLLYATTGKTGLQVFDISDPTAPVELGAWDDAGLAEVEVEATKTSRTVYAASEYWFVPSTKPRVVVLDASALDGIKERPSYSLGAPAGDDARIQGMELAGGKLLVAHSQRYLVSFPGGRLVGPWGPRPCPRGATCPDGFTGGSIADVERYGDELLVTDSLAGSLTVLGR